MQQGYTGPEVCNITGISYRQLDHWTTTKLIKASVRNIKGCLLYTSDAADED